MHRLGRIALCFLAALCGTVALALAGPGSLSELKTAPRFTSAYTDLKKECKDAFKDTGDGQDMPLICKGYGGYKVYIYYSALASHITVTDSITSTEVGETIPLAMQGLNYDQDGRKVEWRLADGKPFAVILRVTNYRVNPDGDNPFDPKLKTGESLLVKGLKGYEHIDINVDAKSPGANVKAREMADTNYNKR